MYAAHFGLRDNPFALTPDPGYLFLSPHHREALAHLLYGTGEDGGFVALTGEVGTGKTTLIRSLLAQELPQVDVALILNPRLTVEEFVAAVCDELQAPYPGDARTLKPLVDALNRHLLANHARGRRTVLVIDEAQNLSREVLEQVRLLTNLETHRHKLLRIMLVGQPELQALLARQDLRQLAQRVTARYHLQSLDRRDTGAYVAHRLQVAGGREDLFSPAALTTLHRLSGGVPRLINIICDRALLGAYSLGLRQVPPVVVRRAARESLGLGGTRRRRRRLAGLAATVAATGLGLGLWLAYPLLDAVTPSGEAMVATADSAAPIDETPAEPPLTEAEAEAGQAVSAEAQAEQPATAGEGAELAAVETDPLPQPEAAETEAGEGEQTPEEPAGEPDPATALAGLFDGPPFDDPLARLLAAWDQSPDLPLDTAPCDHLARQGLLCLTGRGDWQEVRRYNRPVILTLTDDQGRQRRVLLAALEGETARLDTGQGPVTVSLAQLQDHWAGEYLLLWRPQVTDLVLGPGARGEPVRWLRRRLALAEGQEPPADPSPSYDTALSEQVRRFQQANGLTPDGVVGPRTLPLLNELDPVPDTPRLTSSPVKG